MDVRAIVCVSLSLWLAAAPLRAADQPANPAASSAASGRQWFRAYRFREEAPVNLANSGRLEALLRAGKIYLSLQDAIALALENNLDIELQRYGPRIADSDILRAEAGGLLRGVPTSVARGATSAVAQATGTAGGQAAGAQALTGGGGEAFTAGGAIITTTGTAIPNLDPVITAVYNWSHRTIPQTNSFITGTNSLIIRNTVGNMALRKGFLTGTNVEFGWNNSASRTNAGRSDFNPSTTASFNLTITQHLLQGFGIAVNNRNIRIARNNRRVSDLVFRQQVINTVASVVNLYWDLVSFNEDVKVRRQALALAEKLYNDNKKQVEIGTLAPIEIVRAEAEVARAQQDLTVAETRVLQQEMILKNALSRTGVASPVLAEARIVPTDTIRMPDVEPVQPLQDLVARALELRPELQQARLAVENTKIGLEGTKSALRPSLDLVASFQNNALAGQINSLPIPPIPGTNVTVPRNPASVNPFFIGGYGTVLGQLFRRNFPDYGIGFQLNIPLRNRAAQADMIRDQLTLRQQEIRQQQLVNQIRLDVTNALIALQQARASYQAAMKARVLQEQTLEAEEKKYALGASTIFFVIQAQRDLAQARSTEVASLSAYIKAKAELDRATGQILDVYNISLDEALRGQVSRPPAPAPEEE
ncbi:MAG: TolC family protein [Bryobacterales bacterium]|nr:TolC family protein [Bryobacteraceae bacterium]MDW8356140.1 TolC family protein [Bryobacterales bacterium]